MSRCGNQRIQKILDGLQFLTLGLFSHALELQGMDIWHNHKYTHDSIVDALKKKNPDKAEAAVRNHIHESKVKIIDLFLGTTTSGLKKYVPPKV